MLDDTVSADKPVYSLVSNNVIGLNAAQTAKLANGGDGIVLAAQSNTINANVISGNALSGIHFETAFGRDNFVTNNFIGTTAAGTHLGNTLDGIRIGIDGADTSSDGVHNNWIGGSQACKLAGVNAGASQTGQNEIAYNAGNGINVSSTLDDQGNANVQNQISQNSIHDNTKLGIDLGNDGVTVNDPGDGDKGGNLQQNYPLITSAVTASGTTTVKGSMASAPNKDYTLEFFSSPLPSPSNFGEGAAFIGSVIVHTNGSGNASFSFVPASPVTGGQVITATATDFLGPEAHDTSEFSKAFVVTVPPPPPASALPAQHRRQEVRLYSQTQQHLQ